MLFPFLIIGCSSEVCDMGLRLDDGPNERTRGGKVTRGRAMTRRESRIAADVEGHLLTCCLLVIRSNGEASDCDPNEKTSEGEQQSLVVGDEPRREPGNCQQH